MPSVADPDASTNPDCAGYDPLRPTRVWAYGTEINNQATHNWPAFTIEANVRVSHHVLRVDWLLNA
jgi:hypothetical protein